MLVCWCVSVLMYWFVGVLLWCCAVVLCCVGVRLEESKIERVSDSLIGRVSDWKII